jgi:hypothetical protein
MGDIGTSEPAMGLTIPPRFIMFMLEGPSVGAPICGLGAIVLPPIVLEPLIVELGMIDMVDDVVPIVGWIGALSR